MTLFIGTPFICYSQDALSGIVFFKNHSAPTVRELKVVASATAWRFVFDNLSVTVRPDLTNMFGPASVTFQNERGKTRTFTLSYSIHGLYFEKAVSFDADGNGRPDLFIVSDRVGVSGIGENAPTIASFLFFQDGSPADPYCVGRIFSLAEGKYRDISTAVSEFPLFLQGTDSAMHVVKDPPKSIRAQGSFADLNVWSRR